MVLAAILRAVLPVQLCLLLHSGAVVAQTRIHLVFVEDASILFARAEECNSNFPETLELAALDLIQASPTYVPVGGGMLYTQQALCAASGIQVELRFLSGHEQNAAILISALRNCR